MCKTSLEIIADGRLQGRVATEKRIGIKKEDKGRHIVECWTIDTAAIGKIDRLIVINFPGNKKRGKQFSIVTVDNVFFGDGSKIRVDIFVT